MTLNPNKKIDVIMLNMSTMNDWRQGIVNRNFFVMDNLLKDDRVNGVVAVDFLPVNLRTAAKHYWKNIIRGKKTSDIVFGDLTSVCYRDKSKLTVYSTIDSLFSWKTVAREIMKIKQRLNLSNIVLWSYNPMFTEFIDRLNDELFVFDTVDNWMEHSEYVKLCGRKKLLKNYKIIAAKADYIFTVSPNLNEFYRELNRETNVYNIANGVDYEHFNDPELIKRKNSLSEIKQPIIGYVGTLTHNRVDFDLVEYLAKNNPDKKIVMAGPIWADCVARVNELKKYDNLIFPGRIEWVDMPSFLNEFDVAIIPHRNNSFILFTNPMKLYDYLACGLPVVTTPHPGLEKFKAVISLENDYHGFNDAVILSLGKKSAAQIEERQAVAREHSWKKRVDEMLNIILKK
jgi:teichuronic acid biosynthesis glycosyltransferase TuaH